MDNLIPVLVAVPLLGAAVLLCGGRRLDRVGPWLGTVLAFATFGVGLALFFSMLGRRTPKPRTGSELAHVEQSGVEPSAQEQREVESK